MSHLTKTENNIIYFAYAVVEMDTNEILNVVWLNRNTGENEIIARSINTEQRMFRIPATSVFDKESLKCVSTSTTKKGVTSYKYSIVSDSTKRQNYVLDQIRQKRKPLLVSTDYTQLADAPFTAAKKKEWKTYRKALRDITKSADLENVVWPTEPE